MRQVAKFGDMRVVEKFRVIIRLFEGQQPREGDKARSRRHLIPLREISMGPALIDWDPCVRLRRYRERPHEELQCKNAAQLRRSIDHEPLPHDASEFNSP